jgi:hypothetical protein
LVVRTGRRVILAASGCRPGALFNILEFIGLSPPHRVIRVSIELSLRNS